jgi:aconitate hydratase
VVLERSFARLHRANLINFGVLPLLITEAAYEQLEAGGLLTLSGLRHAVRTSDRVAITDGKKGVAFEARLDLSERERNILLAGGRLNHERDRVSKGV